MQEELTTASLPAFLRRVATGTFLCARFEARRCYILPPLPPARLLRRSSLGPRRKFSRVSLFRPSWQAPFASGQGQLLPPCVAADASAFWRKDCVPAARRPEL